MSGTKNTKNFTCFYQSILSDCHLESENYLVTVIDADGRLKYVNEAYCSCFNKKKSHLLGTCFNPPVHPDDIQLSLTTFEGLRYAPYKTVNEYRTLTNIGWRWQRWEHTATIDTLGNIIEIVTIINDITHQKELLGVQKKSGEILNGIALATQALLINENTRTGLQQAIDILGETVGADRCYLFNIHEDHETKKTFARMDIEWVSKGTESQLLNPLMRNTPICELDIFKNELLKNGPYFIINSNNPDAQSISLLESRHIISMLIIPIYIGGMPTGFVGFDDCTFEREWLESDINLLKTAITAIGAMIKKESNRDKYIQHHLRTETAMEARELGLWEWNIHTGENYYSTTFKRMFGFNDDEFEAHWKNPKSRIHPDDEKMVFETLTNYLNGEVSAYSAEYRLLKNNGSYAWVSEHGKISKYDEDETPVQMIGTIADIESRQFSIIKAEENEKRLSIFLNSLPDNIFVISKELIFLDYIVNNEADLLYPIEAFIGCHISEALTVPLFLDFVTNINLCFTTKLPVVFEYSISTSLVEEIFEVRLIFYDNQRVIAYIRNITESTRLKNKTVASENILRTLVNSISDTIITLDEQLNLFAYYGRHINSQVILQSILSFNSENLLESNPSLILFKAQAEKSLAGASTTISFESLNFDENIISWNISLSPLRNENDNITGVVIVCRDITLMAAAEDKLTISELKLLEAQNIAKLANWEYDIETDEMNWSDYMFQLLEISLTSPSTNLTLLISYIHPDDIALFRSAFSLLLATHKSFNINFRVVISETTVKYVECKGVFYPALKDLSNRVLGTMLDITHLKLAEQALRDSEERFRKLFTNHSAIMLLVDTNTGNIIEANESAINFYGYPLSQICMMNITDLNADWLYQIEEEINLAANGVKSVHISPHYLSNGGIRTVEVHTSPIIINSQKILFLIIHDITGRKQAENAVLTTNQRLAAIISTSPEGIGVIAFDGKLEMVSDKLAYSHGYSQDQKNDLLGKSVFDFIDASCHEMLRENIYKLLAGESDHKIREYIAIKSDNSKFIVDINYSLLYDAAGSPSGILFIERDISESKSTIEALAQSEEKFRTIIEISPDPIALFDVDGNILMMNPIAVKMFGYDSESEVLSKSVFELIQTEDRQTALALVPEIIKKGLVRNIEFSLLKRSGEVFSAEFSCSANFSQDGSPKSIMAIYRDITEKKRAIEAVLWNERLLKLMANSSPLGFLIVDNRTDEILYFNDRFCEIWGIQHLAERMYAGELKNSEIIPDCLHVLMDIPAFKESLKPLLDEENRTVSEDEIPFTFGRMIRRLSTQIRSEEDEYYGSYYIFEDVTKAKESEEQVKKLLAKEIALNDLKSQFISTASHEFRTPLAAILSSAELLEYYSSKWTDEKKMFHLHKIQNSVGGLAYLLSDVAFLDRAESNKTPVELKESNLYEFCDDIVEEYQLANRGNNQVEYNFRLKKDSYTFDSKLLRQIITNLIGNAIKYSPALSPVTFSVEEDGAGFLLIVSDKGMGIPSEEQEFVFEAFFRAKNTSDIEGTGLGLPIVKSGVELLGGSIRFISKENEGTTFFVRIPFLDSKHE